MEGVEQVPYLRVLPNEGPLEIRQADLSESNRVEERTEGVVNLLEDRM
jgi:hypothetical protein